MEGENPEAEPEIPRDRQAPMTSTMSWRVTAKGFRNQGCDLTCAFFGAIVFEEMARASYRSSAAELR